MWLSEELYCTTLLVSNVRNGSRELTMIKLFERD